MNITKDVEAKTCQILCNWRKFSQSLTLLNSIHNECKEEFRPGHLLSWLRFFVLFLYSLQSRFGILFHIRPRQVAATSFPIHYKLIILPFDYTRVYSELQMLSFKQTRNNKNTDKDKAIPLQSWTDPKGSRRLRLLDFKTIGK